MRRLRNLLTCIGPATSAACSAKLRRQYLLVLAIGAVCGCRQIETRFDVTSFKDPGNPEQFTERFPTGAFAVDAHHNWEIVFVIPGAPIEISQSPKAEAPDAQPTDGDDAAPRTRTVSMSQYVQISVFWKPKPGTTYAESTQTNAGILYCLVTGGNAISYEGAGFVYFTPSYDRKTITGRIESSTLVPVRSTKEPVDLFGSCRVEGWFVAREDRGRVVEVRQTLRRVLGRPGLAPSGTDAAPTATVR
jgi:hypothetical protein